MPQQGSYKSKRPFGGGPKTAEAIRQAAIDESFFLHWYEATTLRDLAGDVGVKVGSLYNHISSKEELLFSIMNDVASAYADLLLRAMRNPQVRVAPGDVLAAGQAD